MDIKYKYYYFNSIFKKELCEEIIDYGNSIIEKNIKNNINVVGVVGDNIKPNKKVSLPLNEKTLESLIDEGSSLQDIKENFYIRDSNVCFFNDEKYYDLIRPFLIEANEKSGWKYDFDVCEAMQFTVYKPGGFYGWHTDGGSDHNDKYNFSTVVETKNGKKYTTCMDYVGKIRKLSLTINLSDPNTYEGGNLKFDLGPHSEKRIITCEEIRPQGSMVVFPSYVHHTVTPVTSGVRYSLVVWALGYPFR